MSMYLSYSGWKLHKECPRAYFHRYIGKTEAPPENKLGSLYGSAVGRLFEEFYVQKLWAQKDPVAQLQSQVDKILDEVLADAVRRPGSIVDFNVKKPMYVSREALRLDVEASLPRGVDIIRHHRLIGAGVETEVTLDASLPGGHTMGGRADFLMRRVPPTSDLVLLDGKGSKHRDLYIDRTQLLWYARAHQMLRGHLPDQVGFVYWRSEPEDALDWIELVPSELDALEAKVVKDILAIELGKQRLPLHPGAEHEAAMGELFPAKVGAACRFCRYVPVCLPAQAQISDLPRRDLSGLVGSGVKEIGLDD